jgi:DNA-directed RNA polymerase subunit RPC12/RpoP
MKVTLKCHCGQKIFSKDIMQRNFYVRQYGPSYVYIKYRCSRCKKLGEHFIKQEEWDDSLLRDNMTELEPDEKLRFEKLGKISEKEIKEFHSYLDRHSLRKIKDWKEDK